MPRLRFNPVDKNILRRKSAFCDPPSRAKQHHLRVSLDNHWTLEPCEIVDQELRNVGMRRRMELGFRMLDDIDTRSCATGRQCRRDHRKDVREPPAGLHKLHIGLVSRRPDHQIEVVALRGNINSHPEGLAIPLTDRFPQCIVRCQSEWCHLSIRPQVHGRALWQGEWRREELARAPQMANTQRPSLQGVDFCRHPARKVVWLLGNQAAPNHRPRLLNRSRNNNIVVGLTVEPLSLQRNFLPAVLETPSG